MSLPYLAARSFDVAWSVSGHYAILYDGMGVSLVP